MRAPVAECLSRFDGDLYKLGPWVIMPNHVRLLICPTAGHALPKIMQGIKGVSAKVCNSLLGRTGKPFWQQESFDHIVRSQAHYDHLAQYIARNPLKARLKQHEYKVKPEAE
ncbi:MAG: transposase [Verrucomicrobia bacterium]|nr:transposase [Verrucomicrobiota bacterium]